MGQDGLRCVDSVVLGQRTAGQVDPSATRITREDGESRRPGLSVGNTLHCCEDVLPVVNLAEDKPQHLGR